MYRALKIHFTIKKSSALFNSKPKNNFDFYRLEVLFVVIVVHGYVKVFGFLLLNQPNQSLSTLIYIYNFL